MSLFIKLMALLVPTMMVVDFLWIGVIMKDFYRGNLGHLMSGTVAWVPAVSFYIIFVIGLVYFAALPGIASGSLGRTFLLGAAFGFFAYATYDLTNHATLRDWPLVVTLIDMAWGTFFSGVLAALAFTLSRWFA
ncbi:MAG: DUF2177 family protein [Minisyncoccia bacterium]